MKKKLKKKEKPTEEIDEYEGKDIEFEAQPEISMIGLWLYENGHFTKYPGLAVRWAIYQFAAVLLSIYFVIGLIVELKFFRIQFIHFGLIDDKKLNEKLACNNHLYKAAATCIVILFIHC